MRHYLEDFDGVDIFQALYRKNQVERAAARKKPMITGMLMDECRRMHIFFAVFINQALAAKFPGARIEAFHPAQAAVVLDLLAARDPAANPPELDDVWSLIRLTSEPLEGDADVRFEIPPPPDAR